MPYIGDTQRERLEPALQALFNDLDGEERGEFVYVIFRIARRWLDERPMGRYITRSNAVSILADAHHYFRKDYLDEYEGKKKAENGPI